MSHETDFSSLRAARGFLDAGNPVEVVVEHRVIGGCFIAFREREDAERFCKRNPSVFVHYLDGQWLREGRQVRDGVL